MMRPWKPYTMRSPASATSSTSRCWPGSKRTAVPAAMLSRKPRACSRSNSQRAIGFVEMIVRAHLDRPVAGIGDGEAARLAAGVELDARPPRVMISPGIMRPLT